MNNENIFETIVRRIVSAYRANIMKPFDYWWAHEIDEAEKALFEHGAQHDVVRDLGREYAPNGIPFPLKRRDKCPMCGNDHGIRGHHK